MGFYCGIDLLLNFKKLPNSANLDLLYTLFLAFSAVKYILPISLIFALISSLASMIRNNELISLYALGLSRNALIFYPFLWALFFCFVYVGLNFTSFAYANDYRKNILKNGSAHKQSGELFLKFNDYFTYAIKIQDDTTSLKKVKVFNIKDFKLNSYMNAKEAFFANGVWNLKEGNFTVLPSQYFLDERGFKTIDFNILRGLEYFEPKIIETIASSSEYSIKDAILSLSLFKAQNIDTEVLKISLYKTVFAPFFAPFLMLIMYYFFPVISRFFNLTFIVFIALVCTVLVWGILFLLMKFSENGVILSEVGIIMPVVILAFLGFFMLYKNK